MTGRFRPLCVSMIAAFAVCALSFAIGEEKKAPDPKVSVDQAKAAFAAKFNDYRAVIRDVEKLQVEFQTADAATRQKLNTTMAAQITHAQSLVNAMVEAGEEVYRAAPNKDPEVNNLLFSVAKYYTIGRQTGPGAASSQNPDDLFYPIDGGGQYERALPIIKLLIDGGAAEKELYVYGFLCAFMTNDYDLAKTWLAKVKETNALQNITDIAGRGDKAEQQAGLMKNVMHTVSVCVAKLDEYRDLWAKESKIRAAEAKANDLPRVKLTTTKGEITVELFENEAPQTVANFLTLVKQGFYNGSPFHRVLPEFMAQGGAKTEEGQGGPGYTIKCECYRPDYRRHFRGTLSMAHAGRDTGNSQFFLTFVPTPHLNGLHTAFGRVIDGMEVLGDLQRRSPDQRDAPKADRIIKAEVLRDRGHEYKFDKVSE
jgi:cyclophilin family peptidyl-prolyl cis-trans isomerase